MTHIAAFITSPDVEHYAMKERHAARIEETTGAKVRLCTSEEEFVEALRGADIALCWRVKPEWLDQAPRLKWIATPAAGREGMEPLADRPGLTVTHGAFHGEFIAETVVGMILAEVRGVTDCVRYQEAGINWPRAEVSRHMRPFRNSHVVIVGFGRIGEWIARLCKPFGVRITGVRRRPAPKPAFFGEDDDVITVKQLDAILPETDHLVLALPRENDSVNLMDARRLALLPKSACLYSIGRGHCIDEDALVESLKASRLRAAYLDVFQKEPLPADSPLRTCPRVILAPHVSAAAALYMDRFVEQFLETYRTMWAPAHKAGKE